MRKKLAKKHGLPPAILFMEPSLVDMANQYPVSMEEMAQVQGVGKGISKKYGGNNSAFKIEIEEFYKNIINNNFDVNIRDAIKDIAWLQKIVFLGSQKYN